MRCLCSSSRNQGDEIAANRLFASTGSKKARVALVLPLSSFEIVSVTVPAVNREAVARLLPYNLSKVLRSPVTDYVYDWQVVQTFADRLELTVYLYPLVMFRKLQQDLQARQKEIAWFEADVFSACSYLEQSGLVQGDGAVLCILVWQGSISMAVYEQGRISMARSVDLPLPAEAYCDEELSPDVIQGVEQDGGQEVAGQNETAPAVDSGQEILSVDEFDQAGPEEKVASDTFEDSEDIFARFSLWQDNDATPARVEAASASENMVAEEETSERRGRQEWQGYLQNINLEIMRTNDYNVSVLKGRPFTRVFVGGAESFYSGLKQLIKGAMDVQVECFPPGKVDADCDQNLAALCVGALRR